MGYVYLLDLHKLIDQRLEKAGQLLDKTTKGTEEKHFHQGRIAILTDFKKFLTENLNPKLPRRIRKAILKANGSHDR